MSSDKLPMNATPISILYLHACGSFGGSSRSLLETINALRSRALSAHVITPKGNVGILFRENGISVIECAGIAKFDNTEYGFYRGRRWLILLREAYYLLPTVLALVRAKLLWVPIDLIHINDITALPTLLLAKLLFRRPVVLHVRSVQKTIKTPLRSLLISYLVHRFCDAVVAIDETVKRSLPAAIEAEVIHNGFSLTREAEHRALDVPALDKRSKGEIKIAMVGQLHKMKGVYDFIEAARLCKERKIKATFILVGDGSRDLAGLKGTLLRRVGFVQEVREDVEAFVQRHNLQDTVFLLRFTPNIHAVYQKIDVICFPSHLNAVGRPVFEAAFFGVPSIVAVPEPTSDAFIDRETGLRVDSHNPGALADAVQYYHSHPDETKRMGEAARRLAVQEFSIERTARQMFDTYLQILRRTAQSHKVCSHSAAL
jgi:glycosyltransferase involved in cell wall biosynthesis